MSRSNRRVVEPAALFEFDNSELDEILSDDDDEGDDDVKPDGRALDVPTILKGQLSEPRFKTVNLRQLHDLIQFAQVELSPEYQRDVVWSQTKMVGLIQSLFFNYYVPPVIFAIEDNAEGEEVRVCIDGKQRCTSIMYFMEGKIPFKGANGEKFWYTKYGTGQRGGQLLPASLKRKFDNIALQVVEYDNIDTDKQRDIFQRVQLGVALSAPEKLQALGGHWSAWITELQKKYVVSAGALSSYLLHFDVARGRAFQNVLAFVMLAFENKSGTHPTNATEMKFLSRTDMPEKPFKKRVDMALGMFNEIATSQYETAFGDIEKRVAPVEFQFIAYVLFSRMYALSLKRLAREISKMRHYVRKEHVDVRSNNKVFATFWEYIDSIPLTKMPGELSAVEEWEAEADAQRDERRQKKRRREEEDDDVYNGMAATRDEPSVATGSLRSRQPADERKPQVPPVEPVRIARPPPVSMDAPVQSSYAANGSSHVHHDPNSAAYAQQQSRLYHQQHQHQQFARR